MAAFALGGGCIAQLHSCRIVEELCLTSVTLSTTKCEIIHKNQIVKLVALRVSQLYARIGARG